MDQVKADRCDCQPGICQKGVVPPEDCIARLDNVISAPCAKCEANTWHHEGKCIRCSRLKRDFKPPVPRVVKPGLTIPQSGLTITVKCGDEIKVTDKRRVAKILKILLSD